MSFNSVTALKADPYFLKDNFQSKPSSKIWGLKRQPLMINTHSLSQGKNVGNQEPRNCLKITCYPGDITIVGQSGRITERAELVENKELWLPHGVNIWYTFSLLIPKDYQQSSSRLVFAQWKQFGNTHSPFLSLRYINGSFESKLSNSNEQIKTNFGQSTTDLWHTFLINYQLNNNETGQFSIWLDKKLVQTYTGRLGFEPNGDFIHFHLGIYRDHLPFAQALYFSNFLRSSYDSQ